MNQFELKERNPHGSGLPVVCENVQNPLEVIYICPSEKALSHEEVISALTARRATTLKIAAKIKPGLLYSGGFGLFNSVQITHCQWMTMKNLIDLTSQCRIVYALNTRFDSDDMNKFIKQWMYGCMIRLKVMILNVERTNFDAIFRGMDEERIEAKKTFVYTL
uniref:FBA_2 domain-containing protein n=1 Tax=Caenorhabditis tropicalis TaxID=1561998 RepID=A0A1I7UZ82_9PELO